MMIRNIPNRYAQKDFAEELDSLGFKGTYDFLYLPMDKNTNCNLGYCFINFIHHPWAARCTEIFQGYLLKKQKEGKSKYAQVSVANVQGLEANLAHYQDKGVIDGCGRRRGPLIIESRARRANSLSSEEGVKQEHQNGDNKEHPPKELINQQCSGHGHKLLPESTNLATHLSSDTESTTASECQQDEDSPRSSHEELPTTMMIRNLPNRYSQKDFLAEFESLGFRGTYDFLYLPMDIKSNCNRGYCFVNFVDQHWAAKCTEVLDNYTFSQQKKGKEKKVKVSVAQNQGLEANILHYKNTWVNDGRSHGRRSGPLIISPLATQSARDQR
jgi:RNA recognition motif-containing protein